MKCLLRLRMSLCLHLRRSCEPGLTVSNFSVPSSSPSVVYRKLSITLSTSPRFFDQNPTWPVVVIKQFYFIWNNNILLPVPLNNIFLLTFWLDGFGNWSSEGCSLVETSVTTGYVECRCNHMTNFAMLLTADQERYESDEGHRRVLNVISYVGCVASLVGALLTLLTYTLFR